MSDSAEESEREGQQSRQSLPAGGEIEYRIDGPEWVRDELQRTISRAVGALEEEARSRGIGAPEDARLRPGDTYTDCGETATVQEVHSKDGQIIYEVMWENGEEDSFPASEIELGAIDGTIRGVGFHE